MDTGVDVRSAFERDVPQMARLHVQSWRDTYRGLMSDAILDDPGFVSRRERFWTEALTNPRYAAHKTAVALRDDVLVGIAMAGPSSEPDAEWSAQLYVLYVSVVVHGMGVGASLLDAVVAPTARAGLWVADLNPRARAFYGKHGFALDGRTKVEDGMRAVRMVRH